MTAPGCRLLAAVIELYDERDRPVTPAEAAGRLQSDRATISAHLETLTDYELVAPVDDGYRPTVTGRDLLALDVEGGFLVVDVGSGC